MTEDHAAKNLMSESFLRRRVNSVAGGGGSLIKTFSPSLLQVGLLREKTPDEDVSPTQHPSSSSPFREVMQTLERPDTADFTSPPKSADYYKKTAGFFQSFRNKPNFRLPRSASMRTPSPPPGSCRFGYGYQLII